jgi:hypothetical protein
MVFSKNNFIPREEIDSKVFASFPEEEIAPSTLIFVSVEEIELKSYEEVIKNVLNLLYLVSDEGNLEDPEQSKEIALDDFPKAS